MTATNRSMYLIIAVVIISLLAACGNSNNNASPSPSASAEQSSAVTESASPSPSEEAPAAEEEAFRTLTDAAGHEVQVPTHPQKVIAPFIEDPLTALGIKPIAQWGANGVPQHYLQDKLAGVPVLDMSGGLKPEETLSYSPDLIIFLAPTYLASGTYEQFAKIAPTFVLSNDEMDWRGNVLKLGALLNQEDAANKAIADYDDKLKKAKEQLGSLSTDKTAILLQAGDEKGFKLFGPKFYGGSVLYDALGFKQPKLLMGDYETYSMESLEQLQEVDYIFVISGEGRALPPVDNPLWKALPAVKAGHVFDADSGHWFNSNPIANGLMIDDVLKNVHE
ncbi:ABC transporter substrate-binding protein [Cohnella lupini]|uniref:Iron complex transport system substrate-binding protein n=1 Tax=Cohnella lupini TaxID=1294267 RepID=A0A3D9HR05_9BACL|nr:ABC transporter substrate-binding protein [Cohnella lupini]RED51947.1 iron complex transport system substrate-binding protein [Cohnella lupini]